MDGFRCLPDLSDQAIARTIADDGIDILFELGGTTHLNKLQVCAYRPAPVQVSWLGYPHSSGLSCIDYILTDPYITPPHPGLLLEKPFELAESWVTLGELGFHDIPIERRDSRGQEWPHHLRHGEQSLQIHAQGLRNMGRHHAAGAGLAIPVHQA